MYSVRSGLILGFHGCDQSVAMEVLQGETMLKSSTNKYDWLGHGIYFWENSPSRALEFAGYIRKNPHISRNKIDEPAVIGAVINLGFCLDLLDYGNLQLLKGGYNALFTSNETSDFLQNKKVKGLEDKELYPNAGFREKDHIQICIRNPNCIKGFFLPRKLDYSYSKV